jgi:hypothetical protein
LAVVWFGGVGEHAPMGLAEGVRGGVVGVEAVEAGDRAVVGAGDVEQAGVVGGRQRADVAQARVGEFGEARFGVLPGVEDDGQRAGRPAEGGVAAGQLIDHGGELRDAGLVAGIGVGGQWDAAVAGDHQAEADQAQVEPFLFGLAALGQ